MIFCADHYYEESSDYLDPGVKMVNGKDNSRQKVVDCASFVAAD
ncbi:hypothetical protein [Halioxenophilus sp. WMMB6]|nr:hypothetical protein [Halioxenophilus sp. WMMB6]